MNFEITSDIRQITYKVFSKLYEKTIGSDIIDKISARVIKNQINCRNFDIEI